jgi:putative PIN family toxin of toxin-antitoxin system
VVAEKHRISRVVLDTNVLVSALLFGGRLEPLVAQLKPGALVPLFSRATFDEFRKVLSYPRFALTEPEIRVLIEEEVLPCAEVVEIGEDIRGVCRDPRDDIFLSCAVAGNADAIVSGDQDLLDLGLFRGIPLVSVSDFLNKFK